MNVLTSLWVRRAADNDLPSHARGAAAPPRQAEPERLRAGEDFYSPAAVHRNHVRLNYVSRECAACQEGLVA